MIATTLQASLLPDSLPEIPGFDVAVRYWAAGEGTEVGGDFYDVFEVDDRWAVVIGDVCGTGPDSRVAHRAWFATRSARSPGSDAPHDEVLRQVNTAVLRSGRPTFCTVALRHPDSSDERLLVRDGDGRSSAADLSTGPAAAPRRWGLPARCSARFPTRGSRRSPPPSPPGDTVVLYTDGITDVRPPHDLSPEALRPDRRPSQPATRVPRPRSPNASARELSAILPIAERNDDIALLVLKVPSSS